MLSEMAKCKFSNEAHCNHISIIQLGMCMLYDYAMELRIVAYMTYRMVSNFRKGFIFHESRAIRKN